MAKKHKFQTTFASGILSENAFGRVDTSIYANGLKEGENIIIENPGGATRRPGTLFVKEYEEDYVRLLPFTFNTEQTYLLVFTDLKLDIFKDDVIQVSIVTTYTQAQIPDIDFAQSADSMVLTHGEHTVNVLRRLGSDTLWELVPAPLVGQPQELICTDGTKPGLSGICDDASTPTLQNVWGDLNGYPKYCTFFNSRLYLAACNFLPQNVWGSMINDFFNFTIGVEDIDAVYDVLDTDFINPITAIYAERKLFVFSTGAEFVNDAEVITPTASSWQKTSENGSYGTVRPIVFDGGVLYLDRSGRTIRQMLFNDTTKSFDSAAVSMFAETLIQAPIAMGIMRGRLFQASNFLFMVNSTGTMAVLNLSRSAGMAAWTLWTTQGAYKDVISFNSEITYILVERAGKWILERIADEIYVDSGAVVRTVSEAGGGTLLDSYTGEIPGLNVGTVGVNRSYTRNSTAAVVANRSNFFGISFDTRGYGRVVIVILDKIVYINDQFVPQPKLPKEVFDEVYIAAGKFAEDEELSDTYFAQVPQTEFYLYGVEAVKVEVANQDFIGGLPHLIGREVVANLDGSSFKELTVIAGDQLPGGGLLKTYPDTSAWLFDETVGNETYIVKFVDVNLVTNLIEGYYTGTKYTPLTENDFWNAYPITQSGTPVADDEFLEEGVIVEIVIEPEVIFTASGDYVVPPGVTSVKIEMLAGGGSGALTFRRIAGGGHSGACFNGAIAVTPGETVAVTIGAGGAQVTGIGVNLNGNKGGDTKFGDKRTVLGGDGGLQNSSSFAGDGELKNTCEQLFNNGSKSSTSQGAVGYGGEASFGRGGYGAIAGGNLGTAGDGSGNGSGGGGLGMYNNAGTGSPTSGAGAPGILKVSPNGETRKYQVRKMKLITASVPITDGVVETPRDFVSGQAGLFFGVNMETLPFNGGQLTNEPKRIVSVMARFVNTVGLNVANNEVPTRDYGFENLDIAPPKKTGIQKIRLLGYTRETTIRITQNDPLPMTLTSLDIEINI